MNLLLVGDSNLFGRDHPVEAFSLVRDAIDVSDVAIAHAEGMFTDDARELPYKHNWRHSPPALARGFRDAGFAALSVASNVCADRQAVLDTITTLEALGQPFAGIGRTLAEARRPAVVGSSGGRVALLSRTSVFWPPLVPASADLPGAATVKAHTAYVPSRRAGEMPGTPPEVHTWPDAGELDALRADLAEAREQADLVVLSMHWGISSSPIVQAYQRDIARAAIDAGADVIFGHHPHVVQEIELHRGRPIFYSLGNFAFDLPKMHGRLLDGLMVRVHAGDGPTRCEVMPVRRNADNLIAPLAAGDAAWQRAIDHLTHHAAAGLRDRLTVNGSQLRFTCA